jgi:hypothetical protein
MTIPIAISLFSLAASALALWFARFAPANVIVATANRVELTTNPWGHATRQPALLVTFVASNSGAAAAVVLDVAVEVRTLLGGNASLFRSTHEKLSDKLNVGGTLPPPELRPFTSFVVGPGQQITKIALLIPAEGSGFTAFSEGPLAITTCLALADNAAELIRARGVILDIKAEALTALATTGMIPAPGGGTMLKWVTHSVPTREAEQMLAAVAADLENA